MCSVQRGSVVVCVIRNKQYKDVCVRVSMVRFLSSIFLSLIELNIHEPSGEFHFVTTMIIRLIC